MAQIPTKQLALFGAVGISYILAQSCIFTGKNYKNLVQPGHNAILFSKLSGLSQNQLKEGFHFKIPYFQTPIVYNIQTRPITIKGVTANKDMQNVNLALRGKFFNSSAFQTEGKKTSRTLPLRRPQLRRTSHVQHRQRSSQIRSRTSLFFYF